nr:Xaa-Pro dipeptidyl-peptidase [Micromonospora sp. DSM 115978]
MPLGPAGLTATGLAALLTVTATVGPTPAAQPSGPTGIVVRDGVTQPVFSLAEAIEERVWVRTGLDTDHDGQLDRVAIDISRPAETATDGLKVPVIFEHSPYRKDVWGDVPYPSVLVDELPQSRATASTAARSGRAANPLRGVANLPGSLDDYYVPRGYAVVLGQSIGTGDSDGCPTSGDMAETLGTKAVIDWLTGRAVGHDADGTPVLADWTTGAVGMVGVSYNGTLPNMVATTGVAGLRTIVPIAAISSWYDYYRAHGLVVAPGTYQGEDADILAKFTAGRARAEGRCADEIDRIAVEQDRTTGDHTAFWRDRDYVDARRVRASVFLVHGLNDWNVKTENFAGWWDELARHGVARRIWLHQGGHGGPGNSASVRLPDGRTWTYKQTENRWFDHWLWNVPNGIMDEPTAVVQREDRSYQTHRDWPDPAARKVALRLAAPDPTAPGALVPIGRPRVEGRQSLLDEGRTVPPDELVSGPDTASPHRLIYRTPPLAAAARLSGRPEVLLRLSVDNRTAANVTAYLVEYDAAGEPIVVTRGWIDPQNRIGVGRSRPVRPGQAYDLRWTLEPKDHVFRAGSRIGLVVFSTDQEFTLLPLGGTRLTVTPAASEVRLPIVGGAAALGR